MREFRESVSELVGSNWSAIEKLSKRRGGTPAARLSKLSPDGRPPAFGACTRSEMSPVILRCPRVTSADLGQRLVRARASKDERPRLGAVALRGSHAATLAQVA